VEIFTRTGGEFLARWGHYLSGVTWIGLLYYFNFVQTPAFAEFEAGPRTEAIRKLVPRALWWFRFAALLTVLTGITILGFQKNLSGGDYYKTPAGISIASGILMALIMFGNVWGVIWPNQKIVIANAEGVAAGREADPNAAAAGRRGAIASRTNTLLSIPMLFFMGATSHLVAARTGTGYEIAPKGSERLTWWIVLLVLVVLIELNGLGKLAGPGPGGHTKYLDTHKNTIIAGFVLAAVLYVVFEVCFGM
jgi:uncharacterized membrane protein